jgi:di/tripeptidase
LKNIPSFKDGISYGVNIFYPHSVNEWVSISSIQKVYDILSKTYLLMNKIH